MIDNHVGLFVVENIEHPPLARSHSVRMQIAELRDFQRRRDISLHRRMNVSTRNGSIHSEYAKKSTTAASTSATTMRFRDCLAPELRERVRPIVRVVVIFRSLQCKAVSPPRQTQASV